ncbi:site-specific tyrosine recombinase XerC [Caulifigura coniformis]|uniref:Site-specific tyrosine recombinase XerC n=1 Tax=Caulifigura coniformis TaxID=2527983 RepID=A0A517SLR2_9PLAN|nr:site-specific integrase [Caulifigura coniformis]QDT57067.1 site-specific tyrosine recombinase XerC [Caulifigura coniformis]
MSKTPWILTREMFLDEQELGDLIESLACAIGTAVRSDRDSALLDQLIVACLSLSGLRNSEFCNLRLVDADLGSRRPFFCVAGTRTEDRKVHIPRLLARLAKQYISGPRSRFLPTGMDAKDENQALILSEKGRPFDRTVLYRRVVKILSSHGLGERASVQLLRHTYGYLAYKRTGGNLLFTQRQLGHAHPMVTAIYQQFVTEDYSTLADQVGAELLRVAPE